ncbi:hypothetical protein BH11PLA2_BH11PLA2_36190 [soil metagenome]
MLRAIAFLSCLLLAGCQSLGISPKTGDNHKPTGKDGIPERSAKDLVDYLNNKANLVQSVSYTDVSVHCSENGKDMPRLGDSTLFASKPNNFRLQCGTLATSGEVDLGSNDREFWMYVKRMDGPNYFYCSHDEFARGAGKKFPIPFDTTWVMQALGMANYAPDGQYTVDVNKQQRKYLLKEKTTTPNGVPVMKLVVFNIDHESGRKPVVWKHLIVDEKNQTIASAEVLSAKTVTVKDSAGGSNYVQVPSEVVLEWPQQKFRMRLVLDKERVNEDFSARMALFQRPQIRGTNPIDLATYNFTPTSYR